MMFLTILVIILFLQMDVLSKTTKSPSVKTTKSPSIKTTKSPTVKAVKTTKSPTSEDANDCLGFTTKVKCDTAPTVCVWWYGACRYIRTDTPTTDAPTAAPTGAPTDTPTAAPTSAPTPKPSSEPHTCSQAKTIGACCGPDYTSGESSAYCHNPNNIPCKWDAKTKVCSTK